MFLTALFPVLTGKFSVFRVAEITWPNPRKEGRGEKRAEKRRREERGGEERRGEGRREGG